MSVKARVSRRGARDQTYGALENTGVIEELRLNIRDLHAGGENRVEAVETPRYTPVAGKHLSGTRDPRTFLLLPVDRFGDCQIHAGHPASPRPPSFRSPTRLPKPLA